MKKWQVLIIFFEVFTLAQISSAQGQGTLQIEITNVQNSEGVVIVALFDNEQDYLKKAVRSQEVKAKKGTVNASFINLPEGKYAVSLLHDENENGEMDYNMMHIPKEGFGFGNNPRPLFGAPSFSQTEVDFNGKNLLIQIRMKYM